MYTQINNHSLVCLALNIISSNVWGHLQNIYYHKCIVLSLPKCCTVYTWRWHFVKTSTVYIASFCLYHHVVLPCKPTTAIGSCLYNAYIDLLYSWHLVVAFTITKPFLSTFHYSCCTTMIYSIHLVVAFVITKLVPSALHCSVSSTLLRLPGTYLISSNILIFYVVTYSSTYSV